MKKSLVLALSAVVAMFATSCDKNSSSKKTLDAEFTLTEQLGAVTYGQPVELEGTVISSVAITQATAVTAKGGATVGTAQKLKINGDKITGLVFIDSMDASEITVTLGAGDKSKDFSFPIETVKPAARKIGFYANEALCMQADSIVQNHVNTPDLFPVEFTGKGSDTPSFFSMLGVKVGNEVKHVLTLTEARERDGEKLSFAWVNVLQNTAERKYIGSQRGYMFTGCKASSLGGGTTGRQCDIYEVDGHQIKDENVDDFGMTIIRGSWSPEYNEEQYKFVDALFIDIPSECETELDRVKGNYYLSKIQEVMDNATLGEETEPTSLPNKTYCRRYSDAGHTAKKDLADNFKAGDYLVLRSKVKAGEENFEYYYGILQIAQLYDDSAAITTAENGFTCLDSKLAADLFLKPNYFSVKVQCLAE